MPKYRVYLEAGASLSVEVEAEDKDSALDAAYQEIPGGICAQCSGWGKNWSLDVGDFESDPKASMDEIVEEITD